MKRIILGAAAALCLSAGQAAADGMPTYGKAKAADETRRCSLSGYTGVASETVTRGFSETAGDFSVLGGVELTCGRFYVGVDGTNVSRQVDGPDPSALVDLSAGFRPVTGPIAWDLGLVYHAYNAGQEVLDFFELKVGASAQVWRGGTLGVTALYAPSAGGAAFEEIPGDFTESWTVEGRFSQQLPKVGMFSPTFSAALGSMTFSGNDEETYNYWNAGLTLAFLEKWSLDLRYHDTSGVDDDCIENGANVCDGRFVGTLKVTF